jgi:hypothetical protein
LRIALPEAFSLFSNGNAAGDYEDVCHAYWSASDAFVFGHGYAKLGWQPAAQPIELWLIEQVLAFVLKEYQTQYEEWVGTLGAEANTAICRRPNVEELAGL